MGPPGPADPVDPNDDLRRGHVADRQDGIGSSARDAEPARAGGLVELSHAVVLSGLFPDRTIAFRRIASTCLQISGPPAGTWFAWLSRSRKLRAAVARRRDQRARLTAWLTQLWQRLNSSWISWNRTGHPRPPAGRDSFEHSPGSAERRPATTGRGSPGLPRSCRPPSLASVPGNRRSDQGVGFRRTK